MILSNTLFAGKRGMKSANIGNSTCISLSEVEPLAKMGHFIGRNGNFIVGTGQFTQGSATHG
jgi:hypothetical protein